MNELTLIEKDLLGLIARGYRPTPGTPELKKLEELGLVSRSTFSIGKYVVTLAGYKMLPQRVVA